MPTNPKEVSEEQVSEVRTELVQTAHRALRDAHGRLLPGQSSNPSGLSKFEQELLAMPDDITLDEILALRLGKRGAVKLADSLIKLATDQKKPLFQAITYIYDRLEGKPRQTNVEEHDVTPEAIRILEQVYAQNNVPASSIAPSTLRAVNGPPPDSYGEVGLREADSREVEAELRSD